MDLGFVEKCVFCLVPLEDSKQIEKEPGDGLQQTKVALGNKSNFRDDLAVDVKDFQEFCALIKVDWEDCSLKLKKVVRDLVSDRKHCLEGLVCGTCLGKVEGLTNLWMELRKIQRRIDYRIRDIQEVIRNSELKTEKEEKEDEGGHKRKADKASSSVEADYLEFVNTFRRLVKEVETPEPPVVVLSEEAQALANIYERMEDQIIIEEIPPLAEQFDETLVSFKEDNEATTLERNGTTAKEEYSDEDSNLVNILLNVDVDMVEVEEKPDEFQNHSGSSNGYANIVTDEDSQDTQSSISGGTSSLKGKYVKPRISCRFCTQTFGNIANYYRHRKAEHPQQSESISRLLSKGHLSSDIFRMCPFCGIQNSPKKPTFFTIMEHMLSHELINTPITTSTEDPLPPESNRPHICNQCDQRFCHPINLELHKICYHESNLINLKCEVCVDSSFKMWEDLVNHLVDFHGSCAIYSCKCCPMAFVTPDKALEHMQIHTPSKRLPCPECPAVSPSLKELYQHWGECHPNMLTTLKCDPCQETFLMPSSYQRHMATLHQPPILINPQKPSLPMLKPAPFIQQQKQQTGESTPYTISMVPVSVGETTSFVNVPCPHCTDGRIFKNRTTLENHIRIHHDLSTPKFQCNECSKSFVHRSTLRYHVQQVHLGIRYNCPYLQCTKSFTAKSLLKGHMKLHCGEGPPIISCEVCGKIFTSLSALKTHRITQHEQNQPVNCDICGRKFQNLFSLRGHKSEAHNLKPYVCRYCPLAFGRLRTLHQHQRMHEKKDGDGGYRTSSLKIVAVHSVEK